MTILLSGAGNCGKTGSKIPGLLWENSLQRREWAVILYPTPKSDTESAETVQDSPFVTHVPDG